MSLAERHGGNRSVIPDTTRREDEMSTAQEHGNIPSTAAEFAPSTDVDLALAAELAQQLRVDSIRSSTSAGSGHPTSSMSAADLMAVLVGRHLRYDWDDPGNAANDHLIFSKGHLAPAVLDLQGGRSRFRRGADDQVPAVRLPARGAPHPGAAAPVSGSRPRARPAPKGPTSSWPRATLIACNGPRSNSARAAPRRSTPPTRTPSAGSSRTCRRLPIT